MSQPETTTETSPALPVSRLSFGAGLLSYLVPGLGQIAQGRITKGVFFMVILLGMFHAGQAMGGWRNVYMPIVEDNPSERDFRRGHPGKSIYHRWHFAGQFFIGVAAWPAIWQYFEMPMPLAEKSDFWRNFQKEPMTREKQHRLQERVGNRQPHVDINEPSGEGVLNRQIAAGDKNWDIGWVYTVIAGVLNILVIYDAIAGPAFGPRKEPVAPKTQTQTT